MLIYVYFHTVIYIYIYINKIEVYEYICDFKIILFLKVHSLFTNVNNEALLVYIVRLLKHKLETSNYCLLVCFQFV